MDSDVWMQMVVCRDAEDLSIDSSEHVNIEN